MKKKILITAFGPFQNVPINPSQMVLEKIRSTFSFEESINYEILDVSYLAVDSFIDNISDQYDLIIHLGVATSEKITRFEISAQNIANGKDVFDVRPQYRISEFGDDVIQSNFPRQVLEKVIAKFPIDIVYSNDAGTYLCNYIYYKSLNKFHKVSPVLFIHIADFINNAEANNLQLQTEIISDLIFNFMNETKMV